MNCTNTWPAELLAQFPLPDSYEWDSGSESRWPHLRFNKWVIAVFERNTFGGGAVKFYLEHKPTIHRYSVSSPEEAIALIYNLVLFGETHDGT